VTNTNGLIEIDQHGTLTLFDTTVIGGTIEDNGTLLITGTTSKLENVTLTGTATLDVAAHTTFEIDGSVSSGVTVNFEQSNGGSLLILNDAHDFKGTIAGLTEAPTESQENHVDLEDLAYHQGFMSVHYDSTHHQVTISNNTPGHHDS